jgi:hypothetical protein
MPDRSIAELAALDPLVGAWSVEAIFPNAGPSDVRGRTLFEWALGGRFLVQRAEVADPAAPDLIAMIGLEPGGGFLQHYFDSRGVVRRYSMTLRDGVWTLLRHAEPPDFSQRFVGTFSDDGDTIAGAWERAADGSDWRHDFDLVYTRDSAA